MPLIDEHSGVFLDYNVFYTHLNQSVTIQYHGRVSSERSPKRIHPAASGKIAHKNHSSGNPLSRLSNVEILLSYQ